LKQVVLCSFVSFLFSLLLLHVPLRLEKSNECQSLQGLDGEESKDKSQCMTSVSACVALLVDDSASREGAHSNKSLLGKKESDGPNGSKESSRVLDHVLDGSVGPIVHAKGTVFLKANHSGWWFFGLFRVVLQRFIEEGIGSNIPLEAILVGSGDKVDQQDRLSQDKQSEVEPLKIHFHDRLDLARVEFCVRIEGNAAVGNSTTDSCQNGQSDEDLGVTGSGDGGGSCCFGHFERCVCVWFHLFARRFCLLLSIALDSAIVT